jgi:dTDP-glucose 4,6-dehydratase
MGSAVEPDSWDENGALRPSNPYAAAKGASEILARSYFLSFGVPAFTMRTMNIFGEQQDISKFVPATIKKVLNGEPVICHVDETGKSGSRHWIYVGALVRGLLNLIKNGTPGEVYHVVGPEMTNLEIIRLIEQVLHRRCNLQFRQPGASHDMRYSIKDTKLSNSVYQTNNTESDLVKTILWYGQNREWLQ